jgi:hypothetical protein
MIKGHVEGPLCGCHVDHNVALKNILLHIRPRGIEHNGIGLHHHGNVGCRVVSAWPHRCNVGVDDERASVEGEQHNDMSTVHKHWLSPSVKQPIPWCKACRSRNAYALCTGRCTCA